MGSHVSGCPVANRLIETVIAPNFCRICQSLGLMPAIETGVTDHVLSLKEVFPHDPCCSEHCWRCTDPVLRKEELSSGCKTDCEDGRTTETTGAKTDSLRAVCLESAE